MNGASVRLPWSAAAKGDAHAHALGDRRHAQEARRARRDAARLRETARQAQLSRIARLEHEIRNEKRMERAAREQLRTLAAANRKLTRHREALALHRQREESEAMQKRAEYQLRAPWDKAEADPRPWLVFLHDADDDARFRSHAHEHTLRPAGGQKFYPEGHFADFARQELGPRFGKHSDGQHRLQTQKMAARARELLLDVAAASRATDRSRRRQ